LIIRIILDIIFTKIKRRRNMPTRTTESRNKRINFVLREDLHKWVRIQCIKEGLTTSEFLEKLITKAKESDENAE
jgi:hypothetical protein